MRSKILLGLAVTVMALTAWTIASPTYRSIQAIGPYYTMLGWDSASGGQPGGEVRYYLAADTLRIGDAVYLSGANTVGRSTTLANYNTAAGIVVSGARLNMKAIITVTDTGLQPVAATSNQRVAVLVRGRAFVRLDSSLSVNAPLGPSGKVAGHVTSRAATLASDSIYDEFRIFGRLIQAGDSGKVRLANINVR